MALLQVARLVRVGVRVRVKVRVRARVRARVRVKVRAKARWHGCRWRASSALRSCPAGAVRLSSSSSMDPSVVTSVRLRLRAA